MNLHPSLHKTVLVGVSRAPLDAAGTAPALAALLETSSPEARLWHSIAAADLWQRAGYLAHAGEAPGHGACEAEPTCPRAAEQVLQQILRGIHADLLEHWLALAQAQNMALPHAALAALLDMSVQQPALRPLLQPLLGKRGNWLAAQHPEWAQAVVAGSAAAGEPETHWQLGSLAQRCHALRSMRRADPAAALAAIEAEWAREPAENRIALLPCLATNISLADEPFLECALDDKRKEVRSAAQQLLAALPGAQLGERCKARLATLLTLERKSGLGARLGALVGAEPLPQLTVALPAECDKAMKRDGIGVQLHHGLGEKASWLQDLMRCVAPLHWSRSWQLAPSQVVDLFARQEFKTALLTGLAQAAGQTLAGEPDAETIDWFVTLIDGPAQARTGVNLRAILLPELERLPLPEQERIVQRWLQAPSGGAEAHACAFSWAHRYVAGSARALSPQLSRLLLASSQAQMAGLHAHYGAASEFKLLGKALDIGQLDYVRTGWPAEDWEHWPKWRGLVDDLMETLHFRHTMQASFLENDA